MRNPSSSNGLRDLNVVKVIPKWYSPSELERRMAGNESRDGDRLLG